MVEKTKNPSQLTGEDRSIIDQICIACAALFYHTMEKYRTPKEFAQKVLLKMFRSDQSFAIGRTITNSLYHKYSAEIVPSQLSDDLAKDAQVPSVADRQAQGYNIE